MGTVLRWLVRVLGAFFVLQCLSFLVTPARAVETLGMTLQEGVGRSTQIGDMAAFFGTLGVGSIVGSLRGRERLLYFPAGLLGSTALFRTVAWIAHGAAFATAAIAVEVIGTALLLATARRAGAAR